MKNKMIIGFIVGACIFTEVSCDRGTNSSSITGPIIFEYIPVLFERIYSATPLGNLNPPGHVFPTDHIGFHLNGTTPVLVQAIGDGTVETLYYNEWSDDYRIEFKHTDTFYSYYDHISNPFPTVTEGATINAGDVLGYGIPPWAIDLCVVDFEVTCNFIVPQRYHEFSLHCADPYPYFTDSLRTLLLTKNRRTVEPRGGKIDFDIDGYLSGNWFLEGTSATFMASSEWAIQLAFVYDMYDPTVIRITAGGTLDIAPFDRRVVGNTPDPQTISTASGRIKYELTKPSPSHTGGILMVEMLEARRIRVEVFPNKTPSEVTDFTAGASIYTR